MELTMIKKLRSQSQIGILGQEREEEIGQGNEDKEEAVEAGEIEVREVRGGRGVIEEEDQEEIVVKVQTEQINLRKKESTLTKQLEKHLLIRLKSSNN